MEAVPPAGLLGGFRKVTSTRLTAQAAKARSQEGRQPFRFFVFLSLSGTFPGEETHVALLPCLVPESWNCGRSDMTGSKPTFCKYRKGGSERPSGQPEITVNY